MQFLSDMGQLALGSRFKALSELMYALADRIYEARGSQLKGRWFPVLRLLHDRGPLSVSEIAQEIGQTHSAVSQLADRLVREGWLTVLSDRQDERRRVLTLSEQARTAIREIKPVWKAIREEIAERSRLLELDLLGALDKFEQLALDATLPDAILRRAARQERAGVRIVPYSAELAPDFYRLNEQWLRRYFYLEEIDHRVLSDPQGEILDNGGAIFFARLGDAVIGTCALKQEQPGRYELTKMAVEESHQGLGVGRRLLEAAIAEFTRRKGRMLFLETNSKMTPAMRLYESMGFERQRASKPDSHYQRSDVYMIWRAPRGKSAGVRTSSGRRSRATSRAESARAPGTRRARSLR